LTIFPLLTISINHPSTNCPEQDLFYIPVLHFVGVYSLFEGVLPLHFTCDVSCFDQINLLYSSSFPFPPSPITQQLPVPFVRPSSYTDAMYFNISYSRSFSFLLSSPPSPLKQSHYCMFYIYIIHIYVYAYMIICFYIYICLSTLSYIYERKHVTSKGWIFKWFLSVFSMLVLCYI
jgi:hypothetical protein